MQANEPNASRYEPADSPFVDRPGARVLSEADRHRLTMLAVAASEALRQAKTASLCVEWSRHVLTGANSAALAVAALERLKAEIESVDEAYGLNLPIRRAMS